MCVSRCRSVSLSPADQECALLSSPPLGAAFIDQRLLLNLKETDGCVCALVSVCAWGKERAKREHRRESKKRIVLVCVWLIHVCLLIHLPQAIHFAPHVLVGIIIVGDTGSPSSWLFITCLVTFITSAGLPLYGLSYTFCSDRDTYQDIIKLFNINLKTTF